MSLDLVGYLNGFHVESGMQHQETDAAWTHECRYGPSQGGLTLLAYWSDGVRMPGVIRIKLIPVICNKKLYFSKFVMMSFQHVTSLIMFTLDPPFTIGSSTFMPYKIMP